MVVVVKSNDGAEECMVLEGGRHGADNGKNGLCSISGAAKSHSSLHAWCSCSYPELKLNPMYERVYDYECMR